MDARSLSVLIFCCISGATIGSSSNQANDLSIEDTVLHLKQKITQMEERLSVKLHEVEERASKREEEIMKRVSEVEMRCVESTKDISARLQDAEVRFLRMDTHLLVEVQEAREKSSEAIERLSIAEQEVASALESKTDFLQVKTNETREMLNSFVASHRDTENVIRKNISSSTEKLRHLNDSLSSRLESLTTKVRNFENSLSEMEKGYANISSVSKLDQSLQRLDKAIKTDIQSIQSELSPRVELLEEKCALCEDVAEMKKNLKNQTSQITALNTDILDIQKSCYGEPPAVRNGKAVEFERKPGSNVRYQCYPSFDMYGNSTVRCSRGNWVGHPPVCSFFDATFFLRTWTDFPYIYCYSVENYRKIEFSRVLDTGSGALSPRDVDTYTGYAQINLRKLRSYQQYGAFQCGFGDEGESMNIVVHRLNATGDIYFVDPFKVANIGEAVEFKVNFNKDYSVRWRHDGVDVLSWKNKERVEIPNVQPTDAGKYECYYEEGRGETAPALLRLIVRKCKKNLFGEHCEQQCPPCYNGGICHDHLGVCVCPTGFTGNNCEVACGEDRYGADCSRTCRHGCFKHLFCHPDPYGCYCARGWKGIQCTERCENGWYGADCKQPCHCALGSEVCNRFTGVCSGGCSPGWTGQSCQIQVVD